MRKFQLRVYTLFFNCITYDRKGKEKYNLCFGLLSAVNVIGQVGILCAHLPLLLRQTGICDILLLLR
jgi:hypothetical protein